MSLKDYDVLYERPLTVHFDHVDLWEGFKPQSFETLSYYGSKNNRPVICVQTFLLTILNVYLIQTVVLPTFLCWENSPR